MTQVPLPPYIYGRECGPNERVFTEANVRAYANARVAEERERIQRTLQDANHVHVAMLLGEIAKLSPSLRQTLADMLRGHIRRAHKTQAAAARAWGCSPAFVAKVMNGYSAPTDRMLDDAGIVLVPMWRIRGDSTAGGTER